jgi:hypothetical protein
MCTHIYGMCIHTCLHTYAHMQGRVLAVNACVCTFLHAVRVCVEGCEYVDALLLYMYAYERQGVDEVSGKI